MEREGKGLGRGRGEGDFSMREEGGSVEKAAASMFMIMCMTGGTKGTTEGADD